VLVSAESTGPSRLPANARRPLEPGERYTPVLGDESGVAEVTVRSVSLGLLFCALFAMAAAYLALKVGQGIEAAIPISILAIVISRLFARRSTLLENVIVQSIGANSSHVVSGAVFTIPALYMLAAEPSSGVAYPSVWQVIAVSFLGGCAGILFLIPLRHHFMVELHGKLPWPELEPIARQIGSALDYAHSLTPPVLHRDIKPGNIMIAPDGSAKLLDFGIAREMHDSMTRLSGTQDTSGTVPYMSPEQFRGERVDARSDVYSLCVVLYEALAGMPMVSPAGSLAWQVQEKKFEPLAGADPSVYLQHRKDMIPPFIIQIAPSVLVGPPPVPDQAHGELPVGQIPLH